MYNPLAINGKNILITGAASGIGRQCSIDFANAGANLILLDINEEELLKTQKSCLGFNIKCYAKAADLTQPDLLQDIIKEGVECIGKIDGLLHAAGIEKTLPFNKFTKSDFEKIYSINFIGAMSLLSVVTKKPFRGDAPKYVLISSITSVVGRPGVTAYAASKGAIVSAVKTLALELAQKNATINCISPGTILTPLMEKMLSSLSEEQRQERISGFPMGLGRPSDISFAAMFLMSDGARWITGQNLIIDGGFTSK